MGETTQIYAMICYSFKVKVIQAKVKFQSPLKKFLFKIGLVIAILISRKKNQTNFLHIFALALPYLKTNLIDYRILYSDFVKNWVSW